MNELIYKITSLINTYDKFILDDDKEILVMNWENYESEYMFIEKLENSIKELDKYPRKIIYNGKQIILVVQLKIKCEKCGKIFESETIKRRYCDDCVKIQIKNNNVKYLRKKYNNDTDYKEYKNRKDRERFIFKNYYGLILGTTGFGGHRKHDFKKEQKAVRDELYRVLNGKTYTDRKYMDLYDDNIYRTHKTGIKKEDYVTLPNNLNNFQQVEEVTQKIINDLHIETNKIYGVLKISSDYSDEYILYCKVNGRITENRIYTKKDLYV